MTAKQLEEHLDAIAKKAKNLRDAGVTGRVTIGDISFELAEAAEPGPTQAPAAEPANPLDDRDTYGGRMPRRRGAPPTEEDED